MDLVVILAVVDEGLQAGQHVVLGRLQRVARVHHVLLGLVVQQAQDLRVGDLMDEQVLYIYLTTSNQYFRH